MVLLPVQYVTFLKANIMSLAQPKRILVIKLRHHGDVLLATPVVDVLKKRFPDCEVDMLVYAETADMVRDNPQISEIFTIDRQWKKQGIKAQLRHEADLFKRLRARDFDWVFNLSDQWRAAAVAKWCARCSVALLFDNRRHLLWQWLHDFTNPELDHRHPMVSNHLNVLPPLISEAETAEAQVVMGISNAMRERMQAKLRAQGWQGEPYVLIHPGARWFFKCWENGRYAAVAQLLLNHGINVVFTGAPNEAEQEMLADITGRLKTSESAQVWNLGGQLNLRELAAAIDGAALFIGVDSVPMHMAAALDKPQVALFGASWVSRWRPYSEQAEVVWAGDFGHLPDPDSIDTDNPTRLLKAIPVEAVWQAVASKLGLHGIADVPEASARAEEAV